MLHQRLSHYIPFQLHRRNLLNTETNNFVIRRYSNLFDNNNFCLWSVSDLKRDIQDFIAFAQNANIY